MEPLNIFGCFLITAGLWVSYKKNDCGPIIVCAIIALMLMGKCK